VIRLQTQFNNLSFAGSVKDSVKLLSKGFGSNLHHWLVFLLGFFNQSQQGPQDVLSIFLTLIKPGE
jgi:hypothetical protein